MTYRDEVRIGSGAGYSGDRIEPAVELAEKGHLDFLVFECLAERTIALAQQALRADPSAGFDPLLDARMNAVLKSCVAQGTTIITNMGAARPARAAAVTGEIARDLGLRGIRIAAVVGDDVTDIVKRGDFILQESGEPLTSLGGRIVSANAYLGVGPIIAALETGAAVVITGRAADPALFAAPLIRAFGWSLSDFDQLGQATVVGHLLECAGQITGGYFADPGIKDVVGLARLGFPIGEVQRNGDVIITKVSGSGGMVTEATCKEQLLYEIHDPERYYQPDVIADFSHVTIKRVATDRVLIKGGRGAPPTATLKASVGYEDGFFGEGQISYAGPGALARATLARDIVKERLSFIGVKASELRFDLIGVDSLHGHELSITRGQPYEVRLRVIGRTDTIVDAKRIGNEVETLYTNGPAGGGGATQSVRSILAVQSVLVPRELVQTRIELVEA